MAANNAAKILFIVFSCVAFLSDRRFRAFGCGRSLLQGLELVADRLERSELVLVLAEAIDIGAVSGVGGLFRADREVLVESSFLRALHRFDISGDVPGLLDREGRLIISRTVRHVAVNEVRRRDQASHAGAVVETV